MDLVAYVRCSTGKQAEMRKWARANGHKIVKVHQDAISGKTDPSERPGLSDALDMLRPPPRATGLIVHRLDRLARTMTLQETILAVVWRTGASVFTADSGEVPMDDEDDPMRTLVRQIMGGVSQFERTLLTKRMRDGRKAKAARGMHSVGPYAYGFHGEGTGRDRDAAPLSDEQVTIRRIVDLRRYGRSYRSIATILDSEGRKPRRADRWSPMAVRNIVARESASAEK
jgi:DNA invertase Pin-like site-specific DNA recombinase